MEFRSNLAAERVIRAFLVAVSLGAGLAACGTSGGGTDGGDDGGSHLAELPSRGEVHARILESAAPDSDGDCIPDDVEIAYRETLGLDPFRSDTDGDGMNDLFEVFGTSWLYAQTHGEAGTLDRDASVLEGADDPARTNAAELVDSDQDGVPDYYEYFGYRHDRAQGAFVGDPSGFRTDPQEWSTDEDAYPDGMEVSGLGMDPTIVAPGNHPLVPAIPEIAVELHGYAVTLNDRVIYARGGTLAPGESWSRGTVTGYTEVSRLGVGSGPGWADATSTALPTGASVNPEINWNRARSFLPTEAAHLKLYLKVRNRGTAPASNLVPTLDVAIGGAHVATFEPASSQIGVLMPGATYPAAAGAYWEIETTPAGNASAPLALSDYELRALESGAPVSIAVTHKRADVAPFGDVNAYMARCAEVSAALFAEGVRDPGTGAIGAPLHFLVSARDSVTAPKTTLRDAMAATMGLRRQGGLDTIETPSTNGAFRSVSLEGAAGTGESWRWNVDEETLRRNRPEPPADLSTESLLGMTLGARAQVVLRPPREPEDRLPRIYSAYVEPLPDGLMATVCAGDYDGVAKVVFVDKEGTETAMLPDGRGPMFFSCRLDAAYAFEGSDRELVRVTSVRAALDGAGRVAPRVAEAFVEAIEAQQSQPPTIATVLWDGASRHVRATIEEGGELPEDQLAWVRLFHPEFIAAETGEDEDGIVSMKRSERSDDPFGWEADLPGWRPGMILVASTAGGYFATRMLDDMQSLAPYRAGTVRDLEARIAWTGVDSWTIPQVDLDLLPDGALANFTRQDSHFGAGWPDDGPDHLILDWKRGVAPGSDPDLWRPADGMADLYYRSLGDASRPSGFALGFHMRAMPLELPPDAPGGDAFFNLRREEILLHEAEMTPGRLDSGDESYWALGDGLVIMFVTSEGRLGKLQIRGKRATHDGWKQEDRSNLTFDYTIYRKAGDGTPPESLTYDTVEAEYVAGSPIASNLPRWKGDSPDSFSVEPALPAGLDLGPMSGMIHGVPSEASARTRYVVTAVNTGGSAEVEIYVTVLEAPE